MIKIKNQFFFILAFLMASVVALSNYLVQFPINYFGLKDLLTYGALSYPIAFLITDLSGTAYTYALLTNNPVIFFSRNALNTSFPILPKPFIATLMI